MDDAGNQQALQGPSYYAATSHHTTADGYERSLGLCWITRMVRDLLIFGDRGHKAKQMRFGTFLDRRHRGSLSSEHTLPSKRHNGIRNEKHGAWC